LAGKPSERLEWHAVCRDGRLFAPRSVAFDKKRTMAKLLLWKAIPPAAPVAVNTAKAQ
jgi:hypothetical protein